MRHARTFALLLSSTAVVASSTAAFAAGPPWTQRGPHAKFAKEQYLVGLGSASITGNEKRDAEAAEAAARKDILTQIQVSVKGVSEAYEAELRKNGQVFDEARFTDRTEQSVAGTLEGAQIVDVFSDPASKTRYALAVIEKRAMQASLQSAINTANAAIQTALTKSETALDGDTALRAVIGAWPEAEKNESNVLLYRALTHETLPGKGTIELRDRVAAMMAKLTLTVKSGDQQPATNGQPLGEPIVYLLQLDSKPVPEVWLNVSLDTGSTGDADKRVKTNAKGEAPVRVSKAVSSGGPAQHVTATVDWAGWLKQRDFKISPAVANLTGLEARASYLFKTVATTRIAIAIEEQIVWKDNEKTESPSSPVFAPKLADLLSAKGFDVRSVKALGGLTPLEVSNASAADLKSKVASQAEVVITGRITSNFANRMCEKCPTFYKASGSLRAIDTRTGQLVAEIAEPGQKAVGTSDMTAGTKALEEASKKAAPTMTDAIVKALQR